MHKERRAILPFGQTYLGLIIADFRKDNAKALKDVFRAFVKLCTKLGLYQKELLAIDGSKFRAVNSKDNTYVSDK